ncbi:hypothetical protein [Streptomyces sp. NPDC002057]|uniref:hypothetical protein n=1 Tax=Streptomyces sp. NPDC002057 TaxID=3154664 RepID=UPI00333206B9
MTIPLLFLDVDGPLIPFGASGGAYPTYPPAPPASVSPLLARLDPAQGPRLAALPYELVWATTWEDDANAWIAPRLGLPPLPWVGWPDEEPGPEGAGAGSAGTGTGAGSVATGAGSAGTGAGSVATGAGSVGIGSGAVVGLHWKTPALLAWAGGRPFAWVDDEIGAVDHDWVAAHHPGRALLHRVDPRRGLTAADYERLARWAEGAGD